MRILYTEIYLIVCYFVFANTTKYSNILKKLDKSDFNTTFTENWNSYDNWYPEISATGGGNNEFQAYVFSHDTITLTENNTLKIMPSFQKGDLRDDLDLYSVHCTNNWNNGCFSSGSIHWNKGNLHYVNNKIVAVGGKRTKPFLSTKLISKQSFGYGTLSVQFKLPKGRYLWPAIWMLPKNKWPWPTGGEIDLMESMGNPPEDKFNLNYKSASSALHFGESYSFYDIAYTNFAETIQKESFDRHNLYTDNNWNNVKLYRGKDNLIITINGVETLNCDKMFRAAAHNVSSDAKYKQEIIENGYKAGFRKYAEMMGKKFNSNIWKNLPYDAPFHEKFNLIINLAIGGNFFTGFENNHFNIKVPWNDISSGLHPASDFLKNIKQWYDWGTEYDNTNIENIPNVCTYIMYECIKDNLPCNAYKKCYEHMEKHLARKLPNIDSKTTFEIGEITFTDK